MADQLIDLRNAEVRNRVLEYILTCFQEKLEIKTDLNTWVQQLRESISSYVNDIWSDKSYVANNLIEMFQKKKKDDMLSLIIRTWPEHILLICEMSKQLSQINKQIATCREKDLDSQGLIESLKENVNSLSKQLASLEAQSDRLQSDCVHFQSKVMELEKENSQIRQDKCYLEQRVLSKGKKEEIFGAYPGKVFASDEEYYPLQKSKWEKVLNFKQKDSDTSDEDQSIYPESVRQRQSDHFSQRKKEKSLHVTVEAPKVIKFLKESVGLFTKKGSTSIISHLETFEEAMNSLNMGTDKQKFEFVPWVFEPKHRYFFKSLQDTGIKKWEKILSEIKTEFGPYRSVTAARRALFTLKCRENQSPREFLSVLKNAYNLAEPHPDFEGREFTQLFYDALPSNLKFALARDYQAGKGLDWLLRECNTLFAILQNKDEAQEKVYKKPSQMTAETHVKREPKQFESPKRSYAEVVKTPLPKGAEASDKKIPVSSENPNKKGPFIPRRYNQPGRGRNFYYKNKNPEQTRNPKNSESESDGKHSPSNSKNSPRQGQWNHKSRLSDRMDQMQNQFEQLTEQLEKISKVLTAKQNNPFLSQDIPAQSPSP